MRILIIEDEIIIARFIENQLKISYAADTAIALSGEEVFSLIPVFRPHLVLCDIELHDRVDGIMLVQQLRPKFDFEVIFITSFQSRHIIDRAFELKPANYIIKPLDESRLYAGVLPIINQIQKKLASEDQELRSVRDLLNPSELDVLRLIARKKTTKEIAAILHLSPYTIKNYRHKICRKLQLEEANNALLTWALKNQHRFL